MTSLVTRDLLVMEDRGREEAVHKVADQTPFYIFIALMFQFKYYDS